VDVAVPPATSRPEVTASWRVDDGRGSGASNQTCSFRSVAMASGGAAAATARPDAWEPCTSPKTWGGLGEGHYVLTIQASDQAGLVGRSPDVDVYVDWTPPVVNVTAGPPT
jgi:hypothetical protein